MSQCVLGDSLKGESRTLYRGVVRALRNADVTDAEHIFRLRGARGLFTEELMRTTLGD